MVSVVLRPSARGGISTGFPGARGSGSRRLLANATALTSFLGKVPSYSGHPPLARGTTCPPCLPATPMEGRKLAITHHQRTKASGAEPALPERVLPYASSESHRGGGSGTDSVEGANGRRVAQEA
jgi:hypothetical protein